MTGAPTWAIVPVKRLGEAKQRLAGVLPPAARRRLVLTMLQDVLAALRQVEWVRPMLVVTPDSAVAEMAGGAGALVLGEEHGQGHSAAVSRGLAFARSHGAAQALTLPADVPFVTAKDVLCLIRTPVLSGRPCVRLVPAGCGGTNAIFVAPPDALEPSFGPGSFARHCAQAAARRLACRIMPLPGLELDIDGPRDLLRLLEGKRACPRYDFLRRWTSRVRGDGSITDFEYKRTEPVPRR